MITLDILEQRLLPSSYFDACLVCLFSIIINPIFIFPIKTLRVSIQLINRFGDDRKKTYQTCIEVWKLKQALF